MKLSEQTGHDVDAYPTSSVDSLFDCLTLNESAILRDELMKCIELATDGVVLTASRHQFFLEGAIYDMQQELVTLHRELLDSRQRKIDALIVRANRELARYGADPLTDDEAADL